MVLGKFTLPNSHAVYPFPSRHSPFILARIWEDDGKSEKSRTQNEMTGEDSVARTGRSRLAVW